MVSIWQPWKREVENRKKWDFPLANNDTPIFRKMSFDCGQKHFGLSFLRKKFEKLDCEENTLLHLHLSPSLYIKFLLRRGSNILSWFLCSLRSSCHKFSIPSLVPLFPISKPKVFNFLDTHWRFFRDTFENVNINMYSNRTPKKN